jgi:ribonuclease HI
LYEMVVLPVLTYGAVVWWEKSQQVSVMAKLNHLQRLALLAITGAMSTAPTAALEMIVGLDPLNIRIEAVARAELFRLHCWHQFNSNRELIGHTKLWSRMVDEDPLWIAPMDYMVPVILSNHSFRVIFPSRDDWQEGFLVQMGADIVLFTDGSLCDDLAGAGVYSSGLDLELFFSLGRNVSVFQAEVFAISAAVSHCLEIGVRNRRVVLCVDSQSSLLSLRSNKFQSKLVFECFGLLNELARDNDITLVWVPGHSGILGNEKVDELARQGSKELGTSAAPHLPLSRSWAAETIKDWSRVKNLERWLKLSTCSQTKCFITKPLASGVITQIRNLDRGQMRLLCGILSGHYHFRKHLFNLGLSDSTLCPRCEADEDTAFHAVCNCPALASRRHSIFGRHILSAEEAMGLKIENILQIAAHLTFQ